MSEKVNSQTAINLAFFMNFDNILNNWDNFQLYTILSMFSLILLNLFQWMEMGFLRGIKFFESVNDFSNRCYREYLICSAKGIFSV